MTFTSHKDLNESQGLSGTKRSVGVGSKNRIRERGRIIWEELSGPRCRSRILHDYTVTEKTFEKDGPFEERKWKGFVTFAEEESTRRRRKTCILIMNNEVT